MRSTLPIASIILALLAAGSIVYIAWELTSEESDDVDPSDSEQS